MSRQNRIGLRVGSPALPAEARAWSCASAQSGPMVTQDATLAPTQVTRNAGAVVGEEQRCRSRLHCGRTLLLEHPCKELYFYATNAYSFPWVREGSLFAGTWSRSPSKDRTRVLYECRYSNLGLELSDIGECLQRNSAPVFDSTAVQEGKLVCVSVRLLGRAPVSPACLACATLQEQIERDAMSI